MARNRILASENRRFTMLLEESVLRYRVGGSEVMLAQLGHLLSATEMPSVRLGIIPFRAEGRPMWTLEAFTVFDDTRIHVELLSAQVTLTAPGEVILYLRAFDQLDGLAVYGDGARALITDAINALGLTRAQTSANPWTGRTLAGEPRSAHRRMRRAGETSHPPRQGGTRVTEASADTSPRGLSALRGKALRRVRTARIRLGAACAHRQRPNSYAAFSEVHRPGGIQRSSA
jgi:hypothetical protein